MKRLRQLVLIRPNASLLALIITYVIATGLYPLFNKPLEQTYYLGTAIDDWLAFSPVWIIPYVLWYLYLPSVGFLLVFRDKRTGGLTLLTMILGLFCSYLTYSVFQTTVPRPEVLGGDLCSRLVRLIYSIDQPYNAFPSIHVLITCALMLGTARAENLGKSVKAVIWLLGWLIIFSTVFVKQHVLADIFGGIAIALGLHSLLRRFLDRLRERPGQPYSQWG